MSGIGKNYIKLAANSADLCAFMVVCRHGQLSSAAREMQLSQPSLSQRIKNLETAVGRTLFVRTSKGVETTREGLELHRRIAKPLKQVADGYLEFSERSLSNKVLISVDHAFASFWLVPRLPRMREDLGAIDICVLSSQEPKENAGSDTDIVIHMAEPGLATSGDTLLLAEEVSAICSPKFKQEHPDIKSPEDLSKDPAFLLHLNSPTTDTPWCSWPDWLAHFGTPTRLLRKETVFSNYEMIVQAAIGGQGVALGWNGLIDKHIIEFELTKLFAETLSTDRGYFIRKMQPDPSDATLALHDWIIQELRSS